MDLNFSPDFEAFYCYGIVFVVGAFVATSQIRQRIGQIEGIWFFARTWWLFAIYTAVPVVLFWFLDRTGAVNDTSFFAAILVGFGYERIITGGSQMVRAPGDVSQFWTPFIAYADRIAKLVRDQDARQKRKLADRVVAEIGEDQKRIDDLDALAKKYAPDIKVLEEQLKTITASAATRGPAAAVEEKVRALYNVILTVPDGHDALLQKGIISKQLYWMQVRRLRSLLAMVFVALMVAVLLGAGVYQINPNMKAQAVTYYVWRISKTNSTNHDQFRSRRNLAQLMTAGDPELRKQTTAQLASLVQRPTLPIERVELVLLTLLENRGAVNGQPELPLLLAHALRGVSVDVRARINEALKFLAEYCKAEMHTELSGWKPADGDSTAALERKVRRWEEYWRKPCEAPAQG